MSRDVENETEDKEFIEEVEVPEKVEKLYAELLENKKKHESILKFFVATDKVTDSDIVKLKHIVKAFLSLTNVQEEISDEILRLLELREEADDKSRCDKLECIKAEVDELEKELEHVEQKFVTVVCTHEDDDEVVNMLENILSKEANEEVFETKSVTSRDLISTKYTEERNKKFVVQKTANFGK